MPAVDVARASALRGERIVLDVRDEPAFASGHWAGSGHIPLSQLKERQGELPPRPAALLVVAEDGTAARAAAEALAALGYPDPAWLDAPIEAVAGGLDDIGPPQRLWRPSPFLEQVLPQLPRGRALDLAAGAGRESVFLAMHGFAVEAWDDDAEALRRTQALAQRSGVTVTTVRRNLERGDPGLPEGAFQVVTVFRFLYRPLFPHIARALAPGGRLVYETYRRGQAQFGRPKSRRFLLDDGELEKAFPSLQVEHYEESNPPGGPILARLLARRPE
jgi:rhodanese-related sulfurtransferase